MPSDTESRRTRRRRHARACKRCRDKKIRCDFQIPICGPCSIASASCVGSNSTQAAAAPRSTTLHLEEEVKRLEQELQLLEDQNGNLPQTPDSIVSSVTARVAAQTLEASRNLDRPPSSLPLPSQFLLSPSPTPFLDRQAWDTARDSPTNQSQKLAKHISSIPRETAKVLLKHYCDIYRPQYPAIEETDLYISLNKVYNDDSPSNMDVFVVHVALAISTTTLLSRDEIRAMIASGGFWGTAAAQLDKIGLTSSWERLQVLQLLTHYGLLNPQDVDCARCAAAATRLCLQLGLHREMTSSAGSKLDESETNKRRRLFWNSYCIDAGIHTTRCQFFAMSSSITTKDPDAGWTTSATAHIWNLRRIEREITAHAYYPLSRSSDQSPTIPFHQWLTNMQRKLDLWNQATRESVSLTGKLEFYELLYHIQILRLNRPSPRCANPTHEMRKVALVTAFAILREFDTIHRHGKLFYIWHAAHLIVESGLCLLASVLTGISMSPDTTHLTQADVFAIAKCIESIPSLLRQIERRWANIGRHASVFEDVCSPILKHLKSWHDGEMNASFGDNVLKQRLEDMSLFSHFPQQQAPLPDERHGTMFTAAQNQAGTIRATLVSLRSLTLIRDLLYTGSAAHVSYSLMSPPSPWLHDSSLSQDFTVREDNLMAWDFLDLDSTELLASLFPDETIEG